MNIGNIKLEETGTAISKRRVYSRGKFSVQNKYYQDLSRLILFLIMLLSAIVGVFYNSRANQPIKIVLRSSKKSLEHPFRASLEGTTSLRNITLAYYRNRQHYSPQNGITAVSGMTENNESEPPFDALSALQALNHAENVIEYEKEDMYSHGTRHYKGSLNIPGDSESTVHAFEYWMDMRSHLAVRLIISKVERNVAIDNEGISITRETYINIWYLD